MPKYHFVVIVFILSEWVYKLNVSLLVIIEMMMNPHMRARLYYFNETIKVLISRCDFWSGQHHLWVLQMEQNKKVFTEDKSEIEENRYIHSFYSQWKIGYVFSDFFLLLWILLYVWATSRVKIVYYFLKAFICICICIAIVSNCHCNKESSATIYYM